MRPTKPTDLGRELVRFFEDYLPAQRGVSPHTLRSYRDALLLLLQFVARDSERAIERLEIADLTPERITRFLSFLEAERKNGIATRNARLGAIHVFARFMAAYHPERLGLLQRIIGLPFKRGTQEAPIEYLERSEIEALLNSIDRTNARGRRDYALFALMFNTGARVQEVLNLRRSDVRLDAPCQVRLNGKGSKVRLCPIWPATARLLKNLMQESRSFQSDAADAFLFRNARGRQMTRFGVRYLLRKYVAAASRSVTTLREKRIHPHSVRHSTAIALLKAGVDFATISQWLGHASLNTTMRYARADLDLKRQALSQVFPDALAPPRGGHLLLDGRDLVGWMRRMEPTGYRGGGPRAYTDSMEGRPTTSENTELAAAGLRFNRLEWAGAFGDLGTLIPFVVAYIALGNVDPVGIFLSFGLALCITGAYYRTPFPVQPMKAIGAAAATQAGISAGTIYAAGLITGVIWLILGITGAARKVATLLARPVAVGIILGLGLGFMLEGIRMMSSSWIVAAVALMMALLLIDSRRFPVMFLLLAGGAAYQLAISPELLNQLRDIDPRLRLPAFSWPQIGLQELGLAAVMLALPQVPLTLGNAIIAITDENNRIFPQRPVNEKQVAISTGLMNIGSSAIGGVPMCHGAGGMAGHIRFGATTGGAPVILGMIMIALALFFGGSIETVLKLFPPALLGVILFLTGAQLALGSCEFSQEKDERFTTLITAAFAIFNVGVAFIAGAAICYAFKRRWIRL